MNITKHTTVLSVLEKRSLRYRRKRLSGIDADLNLMNQALDETGTIDTRPLTAAPTDEHLYLQPEQHFLHEKGIPDEVLNVHGIAPKRKPDGVTRLIYENPNGFNTNITDNDKLTKAKDLIDELEADVVGYSETRINGGHDDNVNGLSQLFRGGESEIRTIAGYNVHENVS